MNPEKPFRILLVEDNLDHAELLQLMLARGGTTRFTVNHVDHLAAGLKCLDSGGIDAVLLDLGLPDSEGVEALVQMHARAPGVPIVVLTALADERLGLQLVQAGAQDYLVKGQSASDLVRSVSYAIERARVMETTLNTRARQQEEAPQQKTDLVHLLHAVATAANEVPSVEAALQVSLDQVCAHTGWPVGHVYLPAGEPPAELIPTTIWHLSNPQRFASFRNLTEKTRMAPGVGLIGAVFADARPRWIMDVTRDRNFVRTQHTQDIGVRAAFAFPVLAGTEVVAVLEFFSDQAVEPDESFLEIMAQIGVQLGRVFERQRAEEARRASEERFRTSIENMLDAFGIYSAIRDEAGQIVDFRIEYVNAAACALNRLSREEQMGRRLLDLLPVHRDTGLLEEYCRVVDTGQPLIKEGFSFEDVIEGRPFLGAFDIRAVKLGDGVAATWRDVTERVQAESELIRLATAVEAAGEEIMITDPRGVIQYVNPAFERTTGYTREEAIGQNPRILKSGQHDQAFYREMWETLRRGEVWRGSLINRRKDGTLFEVEETIAPVKDASGRTINFVSVEHDVTERKWAEKALREANELLERIFSSIHVMIAYMDKDFNFIRVNQAYAAADGREPAFLIGKNHFDLYPNAENEAIFRKVVQTGEPYVALERPFVYPQNPERGVTYWDWTLQPVKAEDGTVQGLVLSLLNVTERKRAEEERARLIREQAARAEAEAAQRRFAFLAEASGVLVASFDDETALKKLARLAVPTLADYCVIHLVTQDGQVQPVAAAHRDPAKEDLLWELLHLYLLDPSANTPASQALRTGEPEFVPEVPEALLSLITREAEQRRLIRALGLQSYIVVPLLERGRVLGIMTFVVAESGRHYARDDLALAEELGRRAAVAIGNARLYREVQKLNRELVQRAGELTAANKELEAFSYSVSHDLRAPLRAIDGFSRILVEDYAPQLPPEAQRYLQLVQNNTRQMGDLIDDLLAFSRVGRQPLTKESIAPAHVVRQALEDLRAEQEGRRVEIVVGELCPCQADPALLKQVFVNLLSNALKFTRTREVARIAIGCREEGGDVVYFVKDNGVGFDMRYAGKLFGVFQRLHRAEEYEGTGVGLAIVQRIIHRHGGRIWAQAEPNQGTTFAFTLGGDS